MFAWTYDEMPGLSTDLVCHSLHITPHTKSVKQPARVFKPEIKKQIKEEIEKLLKVGFIKPIQHPIWLTNIVLVKKNGQIRCCVDFLDLNKACPKDDLPLPNMDLLIDATAGHEMFSFMDGYSGYNQIKMNPVDAEKTAFRTPIGNLYYTVMPFGLKNAGATYQRAMTAIFHDMMHEELKDYVDDIVVKSKQKKDHVEVLRRVLQRCREYKLKINPMKCAFEVTSGKFLGYLVNRQGTNVDPAKTKAVLDMPEPTSAKELKSFLGKASYLRRFLPGLAALSAPLMELLKKKVEYKWEEVHRQAFAKIKETLANAPVMMAPIAGKELKLYLAFNDNAIGIVLAQDDKNGQEKPIYYASRILKEAEARYTKAEKKGLALIYLYAAKKLRHYMLAHKIKLVVGANPIKVLAVKASPIGKDSALVVTAVRI